MRMPTFRSFWRIETCWLVGAVLFCVHGCFAFASRETDVRVYCTILALLEPVDLALQE